MPAQLTNEHAKICQVSKKIFITEIIREGINLTLTSLGFLSIVQGDAVFPWGSYHHRTGLPALKTLFPVVELDSIGTYCKRKD